MPTIEASLSATLGSLSASSTAVFDKDYDKVGLLLTGDFNSLNQSSNKIIKSFTNVPVYGAFFGDARVDSTYAYAFPYGDGVIQFDGAGYCKFNHSGLLDLGGGDWTIEFWYWNRNTTYSNYRTILSKRDYWGTDYQIYINITNGKLSFYNGTPYVGDYTLDTNGYQYIIYEKYGTNITGYINGSPNHTFAASANSGGKPLYLGTYENEFATGCMKNLRITKGIARYQGNPGPSGWGNQLREYVIPLDLGFKRTNEDPTPIPRTFPYTFPEPSFKFSNPEIKPADYWFGGNGIVTGFISTPDAAISAPITLLYERDGTRIKTIWSNPDGSFEFNGLRTDQKYIVVAEHPTREYSSTSKDNILPTLAGTNIILVLGTSGSGAVLKRPVALYNGKLEELRQTDSLYGFLKSWEIYGDVASKNLSNGDRILADTTTNPITLNLPSSPAFNACASVKDYAGNSSNNNITINASHNFEGVPGPYVINTNKKFVEFTYTGATKGWVVTSSN